MNIPYIMNIPYNKLLARFCIDPKGPMTDPNQLCLMPNVGIYVELVEIMRKLKMVRGYKGPLVRFKKWLKYGVTFIVTQLFIFNKKLTIL